jgi:hypothetical protein
MQLIDCKRTHWWKLSFFWFPYVYVAFNVVGGGGLRKYRYVEICTRFMKKGWYFTWDTA